MSGLDAVNKYAAAKSQADVATALEYCTDDVLIETIPFQLTSQGKELNRAQLEAFFQVFPDYDVSSERVVEIDVQSVVGWGEISATMQGAILDLEPTGRRFSVPFTCVWEISEGLIARERFYFDLNAVCEQLGLDTADVADRLRQVRAMFEPAPA